MRTILRDIKIAAVINMLAMFVVGMFFAAVWITEPDDLVAAAAAFWGIN